MPAYLPHRISALFGLLCLVTTAPPASAQWIAAGRWGTETDWRYVAPGTWMVLRLDSASRPVTINAEGDNHVGRIELWCDPDTQSSALRFGAYRGLALHQPAITQTVAPEPVTFDIDGQAFERQFTYDPAQRIWTATDVLDARFLDAFSWGSRLQLRNSAGDEITSYRLSGSSAAREALRHTCHF